MRTKINLISWSVFLMLLHHMTMDKPSAKISNGQYRIENAQKVAYKKPFKIKRGRSIKRS